MKKTYWVFQEFISGSGAIFDTYEEANAFRRKMDISFLEDPKVGEPMDKDDWSITEMRYNPNFDQCVEECEEY